MAPRDVNRQEHFSELIGASLSRMPGGLHSITEVRRFVLSVGHRIVIRDAAGSPALALTLLGIAADHGDTRPRSSAQ